MTGVGKRGWDEPLNATAQKCTAENKSPHPLKGIVVDDCPMAFEVRAFSCTVLAPDIVNSGRSGATRWRLFLVHG